MMGSGKIAIVIILFFTSCSSFHIAKKRYSDGFYVDYSKSEIAKNTRKKSINQTKKNAADSTSQVNNNAKENPDSLVNSIKDSTMKKTQMADTINAVSVIQSDSIKKIDEIEVTLLDNDKQQIIVGDEEEDNSELENLLLFILCIIGPPFAVSLKFGDDSKKFKIAIVLTILGWIPGVFYAFFQISGDE
jgi:uncharacterized membrane protein YqaE (UPF0057 family)